MSRAVDPIGREGKVPYGVSHGTVNVYTQPVGPRARPSTPHLKGSRSTLADPDFDPDPLKVP